MPPKDHRPPRKAIASRPRQLGYNDMAALRAATAARRVRREANEAEHPDEPETDTEPVFDLNAHVAMPDTDDEEEARDHLIRPLIQLTHAEAVRRLRRGFIRVNLRAMRPEDALRLIYDDAMHRFQEGPLPAGTQQRDLHRFAMRLAHAVMSQEAYLMAYGL